MSKKEYEILSQDEVDLDELIENTEDDFVFVIIERDNGDAYLELDLSKWEYNLNRDNLGEIRKEINDKIRDVRNRNPRRAVGPELVTLSGVDFVDAKRVGDYLSSVLNNSENLE
jgi:PHD/YefM family antitoxin component YafN of YafNO toxin-antitoxin module